MRIYELTERQLNCLVAWAQGYRYVDVPSDIDGKHIGRVLMNPNLIAAGWKFPPKGAVYDMVPNYCGRWQDAGPLIESAHIELLYYGDQGKPGMPWESQVGVDSHYIDQYPGDAICAEKPLIAMMRAYVYHIFGDTAPEEISL